MPFLFLALGLSAYKFLQPSLVAALFLFFIAYVGFSTIHLNTTWRTGETLWSHSLNYGGDSLAHLNLGSLRDRTDYKL